MNFIRILTTAFLLTLAVTLFGAAVVAQKQAAKDDKILVGGDYALRQSDFDGLADFYQWLLGAKFSDAEQRRFQTLSINYAREKESNAKAVLEIVQGYKKIQTADEEKREQARRELLPAIVSEMEKNEEDETSVFLLGVYRSAQNQKTEVETDRRVRKDETDDSPPNKTPTTAATADLAGLWSTSSVSGERYKSLVTGELSDPSGTIIEYQIAPTGTVKHVGYMSVTNYTCTSKLFISRTGRVSVSGSTLTLDFAPGQRIYQACSASDRRTDTLPAEKEIYSFRLARNEYGVLQLCTERNGKNLCFNKKK